MLGIFADGASYTANSTSAHDSADRLFVIGNGTGSGARANALVMLKSGATTANGSWDFDGLSLNSGQAVDTIETTITDDDTHFPTSGAVVDYVAANGDNLGDHTATTTLNVGSQNIDGTNFDVIGASGNTTVGGTLTVVDGVTSLTEDSAATAAVVDVLSVNASTSGTVANNFGVGLTFDAEDLGGIEEQGSIDLVVTSVTDAAETSEFVFSVQEAGAITPEVTISGGGLALATGSAVNEIETAVTDDDTHLPSSGAVVDYVASQISSYTVTLDEAYDEGGAGAGRVITVDSGAVDLTGSNASAPTLIARRDNSAQNAVQDVAYFEVTSSGGAGLNGIGAGLSFYVEDGGDTEEQASIDAVVTDVTNNAEESAINFSVQSAGAITQIANVDSGGFDVTGNITATGTVTSSSDASLKTNINPLENALASVLKINGVSFDWIGGESSEDGTNLGVIAQNVQEVYPQLVETNEAGLTVNYGGLVAPLIEAVKELKAEKDAEIEALQAQVAALQAQLAE